MPAKVVFANGSKAMAHNLDDQYERWMLKRGHIQHVKGSVSATSALDTFVPALVTPTSYAEAVDMLELVKLKQLYVQERISTLKSEFEAGHVNVQEYERQRAPIAAAITRANLQIASLNRHLSERRTEKVQALTLVKSLNEKVRDGDLSDEEALGYFQASFELKADEMTMRETGIVEADLRSDYEASNRQRDLYIERIKADLVTVQHKLIAAYERIIELQAEQDAAE